MNVLIDRHHGGLFHSLQLLGDRLDWTVYTPIGQSWWDERYWNFGRDAYRDDRMARQFLADDQPPDEEFPKRPILTVTLDQARTMEWGVVMATVQDNQEGFWRFAQEHGAKYALHVGNTNQEIARSLSPLVLNASEMDGGERSVHIGEEFDKEGTFAYSEPVSNPAPRIGSFVNLMPYMNCYPLMQEAMALAPDFDWRIYGILGPDGNVKPVERIAELMAAFDFAWHDKETGDGWGMVIHYWASIGRPLIGHGGHYRSKMGWAFWRDLETCIDLDKHTIPEAVQLVREITADPARHRKMCENIRAVLDATTDWPGDAAKVAALLA